MYNELWNAGGKVPMWKVGDALIKARMKETGAALADEMSGHIYSSHTAGSGSMTGARLLELLARKRVKLQRARHE
jgi:phosphomannomutase/phosphoglucomutase